MGLHFIIMSMLDYEYWPCPFCGKGTIELMVKKGAFSAKRTACRAGRGVTMRRSKSESVVVSDACPNCGKKDEEMEKKWREEGLI